jgi:hypothetical protein
MRTVSYSVIVIGLALLGASLHRIPVQRDHILMLHRTTEQPHRILIKPAACPCNLVAGAVLSHVPHRNWRHAEPG